MFRYDLLCHKIDKFLTCGFAYLVWPAFWSQGPVWPDNGEIDIIEGVSSNNRLSTCICERSLTRACLIFVFIISFLLPKSLTGEFGDREPYLAAHT